MILFFFSSTYGDLEDHTDEIWKFENYAITYEFDKYHDHFPFPPPFNFIANIFDFLRVIVGKIKSKNKKKTSFVDSGDKIVIEKEQKYTVIVLKNETLYENEKTKMRTKYKVFIQYEPLLNSVKSIKSKYLKCLFKLNFDKF